MPPTTLRTANDPATQRSARGSVQATGRARPGKGTRLFAPAIGLLLLAPGATFALELGEASIKSALGQSLVVEIPYRLADSEQVVSACVGLAPERTADDLPTYSRVTRIAVTPTHIQIFDDRRVVEPLIGLNIEVHCAGAPHFVRSYQLFVDPPTAIPAILSNAPAVAASHAQPAQPAIDAPTRAAPAPQAAPPAVPSVTATSAVRAEPATSAQAASAERTNLSPRARGLEGGNLPQGQTYRVVRGDTLSGIAARIAGRPVTITEAADAIFAANPAAFTRGNPDLIEEGRSITIPNLAPSAGAASATVAAPVTPVQPAIKEADPPTAAPVAAASDPAPAPPSAAQPVATDVTPNIAAADASPPAAVAQPSPAPAAPVAAPVTEPTRAAAPGPATRATSSGWLVAAVAAAALILLAASAAFVRGRRKRQDAEPPSGKAQEPVRRRPVELPSRMDVVEGSLTGTHARQAAALRAAMPAPAAALAAAAAPDLSDLAQSIGPTDAVDFDVGAAVAATERPDDTDRAYIIDARDDTMEEAWPTARMPNAAADTVRQPQPAPLPDRAAETVNEPIDDDKDEKHTLTVVELDLLRQDYETEHTLTQQSSQALRDAVADLEATKKAHAASAETATLESPQVTESADTVNAPTARLRTK